MAQGLYRSDFTRKMKDANKKREEICRGFFGVVKGSQKQLSEEKQDAAMRVSNMLEGYINSILKGSYAEVSAAIYNLLQDLRGKYAADLTLLGIAGWVDTIAQAEQHFLTFRDERYEENMAKPQEKLHEIRTESDIVYTAMMNAVDGELIALGLGGNIVLKPENPNEGGNEGGGSGPVEESAPQAHTTSGNVIYDFVAAWNDVLKGYRNLLHQRAGRKEKLKSEEEEEEEEEDLGPVEE